MIKSLILGSRDLLLAQAVPQRARTGKTGSAAGMHVVLGVCFTQQRALQVTCCPTDRCLKMCLGGLSIPSLRLSHFISGESSLRGKSL